MNSTRKKAVRLAVAVLSAAWLAPQTAAANAADVEAGEYVATAAGCAACHTAPDGAPYAGGRTLETPFGKLVTPNVTPDEATGIGGWSYEDFDAALRQGIRKDGLPLYPGMPYSHYTKMTDADLKVLWAYVRSLKPVSHEVEVNELPFPYDVRPSVFGWQVLFFDEGRFQPDAAHDDAWNRGAYLVEALAHCGACHTPRDAIGGPIESRALQGGAIEEWYAPDISNGPESVIADWSVERLEGFLSGDDGMNHVAVGSMRNSIAEVSQLKPADLHAIAVYLKNRPADADPAETTTARAVPEDVRQQWGALFRDTCASCHGDDGEGKPGIAASLVGSGAVLADKPTNVVSVLLEGIAPAGDYGVMPSFRDQLTDAQISALANYVRTSWGNDAPANAQPSMVAGLRRATSSDPEALAGSQCPNVAAEDVDDATRAALADLAKAPSIDDSRLAKVVDDWRGRHPDVSVSDEFVDLGGVYCQEVVKTGAPRSEVMTRLVLFSNAMVDADKTR